MQNKNKQTHSFVSQIISHENNSKLLNSGHVVPTQRMKIHQQKARKNIKDKIKKLAVAVWKNEIIYISKQ